MAEQERKKKKDKDARGFVKSVLSKDVVTRIAPKASTSSLDYTANRNGISIVCKILSRVFERRISLLLNKAFHSGSWPSRSWNTVALKSTSQHLMEHGI